MPHDKRDPAVRNPSPYDNAGSEAINATIERVAPAILELLADGVPRTKAAVTQSVALSDYERGRQDERQAILRWMVLCLRGGEGVNRADARVHELRGRLRSQGAGSLFRLGWARRCSMSRIIASLTMVSETSGSSSYSLASRRQRPSQASVRSATHRRGRRTKPVLPASRRTTIRVSPSRKQASRAASRS